MINRQALIGLIGANIMKSLAPALHIDAFAAAGITGHYHLMDVDQLPGRTLQSLLEAVKTAGFIGVNITFPFKQEVIPLLDELSPEARQTGAVNTVTIAQDGHTTGYNTDRSGFRLNFEDGLGRAAAEGKTAVLVGAGGAGSAVAFALMDLGLRDADRARQGRRARHGSGRRRDHAFRRRTLPRVGTAERGDRRRGWCRERHPDRHGRLPRQSGAGRGVARRRTGSPTSSTRRSKRN